MDGTETAADLKEGEEDAKVVYPRDAAQEDEAADGAVEGPTMSTSSQQNEEEAAADSDRCHTAEVPSVEDGLRESPLGDVASIGGTKEEAAADSDRCHTAEVPSVEDGLRESPLGDVASIGGTKEPAAPESHEPVAIPVEDGEQDAAKVASPRVEEPQPACVAREEEQDAKESQEPALAAPGLEDRCPTSPEGAGVLLSIDSHDGTQVISPIVEEPSMEDEETVILETGPGDCQLPEPANGPELSEPVLDSEPKEHPLPSETILVPGSPQGSPAAGTRSGIPDAVFHQVPLMPPGSFFDPTALQQWTEKARAEYSELLSWLMSPLGCDDAERLLQEHQEQEEEEADCQALVLRVARRHMWRERSKRMKLRPTRPIRSKVPSELFALAKMEDEASLLVKGIEKRQSELAAAIKQQQEVRGEIAVWNKRVTDLEMQHVQARAVDEHRGNLSTQVPMMRAESMPVLGKAQAFHPQMPQVPWVPPWAQTSWTPQLPPASVHVPHAPHTVGQVHAGAQPAAVGLQTGSPQKVLMSPHLASPHLASPHLASPHLASPHLASPQAPQGPMPLQQQVLSSPGRQVGGLTSPGGLGSPPTRIVSWSSPRSPLSPSPGSSLLPVRQPGSHLVPSGSLRLPPQVPGANMVRMVNSYSAGQLPKAGSFLTPAAAPNLQVQSLAATMPGTHPVSSCPSFRPVETEGAPQVPQS